MTKKNVTSLFIGQCSQHIELSQLICAANQLTGFYIMGTSANKGLKNDKVELLYHFLNDENHAQIVSPGKKKLIRSHVLKHK